MSSFLTFSSAVSIAIHGIVMISRSKIPLNVSEISEAMGCSNHHVAKILQMLAKLGYISSKRGVNGGFVMAKRLNQISLMDVYEAIEGKLDESPCIAPSKTCPFGSCLLCGVKKDLNKHLANILHSRTLNTLQGSEFDLENAISRDLSGSSTS